ncbi:MAG: hypothetical protein PHH83_02810 [Patescibacteria group bacterium]|nr:hypothetical protein [Patescibacteria group bacterium]
MKSIEARNQYFEEHPNLAMLIVIIFCLSLGYAIGRFGFKYLILEALVAYFIAEICNSVIQLGIFLSEFKVRIELKK